MRYLFILLLTVSVWIGVPGPAHAKDKDPDQAAEVQRIRTEILELKKENARLDKEISKNNSLQTEEEKRFQMLSENNRKDQQNRSQELAELKTKIEKLKQDIQKEKNKQNAMKSQLENNALFEKKLRDVLIEDCQILAAAIQSYLPWEQDVRLERIQTLKRDLETGTSTFEEGFARLQGLYDEEIKNGDQISLINKPLTRQNGETVNAQILKIGNQWIVYMDEEGRNYGILQRMREGDTLRYVWKEDVGFEERKLIREALDVKMAKKPPKLVSLPLTISLDPSATHGGR